MNSETCCECDGRGYLGGWSGDVCNWCDGTGEVPVEQLWSTPVRISNPNTLKGWEMGSKEEAYEWYRVRESLGRGGPRNFYLSVSADVQEEVFDVTDSRIEDGVLSLRKADGSNHAYVVSNIIGWYSEVAS